MRTHLYALGLIFAFLVVMHAQAASTSTQASGFDVAVVRANHSGARWPTWSPMPGGRLTVTNVTLRALILWAYGLQNSQLVGGPAWISVDRFDILAKSPGNETTDALRVMLRGLLEERFGLRMHGESRELPVYDLVVADRAIVTARLTKSAIDCSGLPSGGACDVVFGYGSIHARGMRAEWLATELAGASGRVIVDRTGVKYPLDFDLTWMETVPGVAASPDVPSIFTALREQLGLRLEPAMAPVQVLLIDQAEQPSAD